MAYDDGRVRLDEHGITLRRYYFPLATSKHVAYTEIRGFEARPMSWLTGRIRLWGSTGLQTWLPLDVRRVAKSTLVVLDLGTRVRPAFSPDDPDEVLALLRSRVPGT